MPLDYQDGIQQQNENRPHSELTKLEFAAIETLQTLIEYRKNYHPMRADQPEISLPESAVNMARETLRLANE